jgi:hypothetical protein
VRRRNRHGRGLRGPLAAANPFTGAPVRVNGQARGAELFAECLHASVAKGLANCPRAFDGIDIGYEEIPSNLNLLHAGEIPLAAATSATNEHNAAVVLFRRPLERRASTPIELRELVHRALIEQLSALTGIALDELDPDTNPEDWD